MDITRLMMRMARMSRRPPSMRAVIIGAVAIAVALAIFALEYFGLAPDWATAERIRPPRVSL